MYHRTCVTQFSQMLTNLSAWLGKAKAHAESNDIELENLLTTRLHPNQYHLRRQIQAACDIPKLGAARLTGKEAPKHEDTDQSWDELLGRINDVKQFLQTLDAADFEGAGERKIPLAFAPGKYALGEDYLHQFAIPNFYFHVSMAYAILRHVGVPIGKRDLIGFMSMHDA